MNYFLVSLITLVLSVVFTPAQRGPLISTNGISLSKACRKGAKLVDANKPMVYLSFLRREKFETAEQVDYRDILLFRLTNNTCWSIWLDMSGESDVRYGDAKLYYAIEDKSSGQRVSGTLFCHVCSTNPLSSGKFITFSIPFGKADRGAVMRLRYEFDWEKDNSDYEYSNSLNTVAYSFGGLPESALARLSL